MSYDDFNFGANVSDVEKPCMGNIKCAHCGRVYGVCSVVEVNLTKEGTTMLGSRSSGGSSQGRPQRSGYTYITEADLSHDKQIAKVLAVKENDTVVKEGQRKFSDVIVKVSFKGAVRLFGVKFDTPNWDILKEGFTADENAWPEREFYLFIETEEFTGRNFPRVETVAKKKTSK